MSCRLKTTVLCLATHTRAYDDLTFHLSSIAFALHCPSSLGGSSYFAGLGTLPKNVRGQSAGIKSIKASATDQWCCKILI
jgi:hypothetical protein